MARRSNQLINHALLTDILARQREADFHAHDDVPDEEKNHDGLYPVFPASELGHLRTALNPSASNDARDLAAEALMFYPRRSTYLDGAFSDLGAHLRVLGKTAPTYLRSPLLVALSLLMFAGHVGILIGVLGITNSGSGFGSDFFNTLTASWTIFSVVVLTLVAFYPLFFTSLYTQSWWVSGGQKHKLFRILIPVAAIPPALFGAMIVSNSGANPLVPAVLAAHVILPFVVRSFAMRRIRRMVRDLRHQLAVVSDTVSASENTAYLESILKRKVIGTPGASLATSEFSESQVSAGVAGERKTAAALDAFVRRYDNAVVFHSVRWNMDGAPYDIDHVVVVGGTVFFLDSKNWSKGDYKMLASGDTVLRDGQTIPNGSIHVQSGADTYINAFGISRYFTQVVVWSEGSLSNEAASGPRLVTADEMLDWLNQSAIDPNAEANGYNVPLLRSLEANTAS